MQSFTAVAKIVDRDLDRVVINHRFQPYRRDDSYENCREVPIRPLIEQLEFIINKKHWGFPIQIWLI